MANLVYANPFGAAIEGKRAGLEDFLKARSAENQQRYLEWYLPMQKRQLEDQAAERERAKKHQAFQLAAFHYAVTKNPAAMMDAAIATGMDPETVRALRSPEQLNQLAQGAFNMPFAMDPSIYSAGGMTRSGGMWTPEDMAKYVRAMRGEQPTAPIEQDGDDEDIYGKGGRKGASANTASGPTNVSPTPTAADIAAGQGRATVLSGNQKMLADPNYQPTLQEQVEMATVAKPIDYGQNRTGMSHGAPAPTKVTPPPPLASSPAVGNLPMGPYNAPIAPVAPVTLPVPQTATPAPYNAPTVPAPVALPTPATANPVTNRVRATLDAVYDREPWVTQ